MSLLLPSPCKVNLLLNILGKRPDGFHELETVIHPVPLNDQLSFRLAGSSIRLSCNDPSLPIDGRNLVFRAAAAFCARFRVPSGIEIHLEKNIPHAAGLGGGSGNAATTLLGLNQLHDECGSPEALIEIAANLGSDIPFFLQDRPALATGRGEKIEPLDFFPALRGYHILLIHPGFGISTPWAYQELANHPEGLNGKIGRAGELIEHLRGRANRVEQSHFFNALELPALAKYPLLALIQQFLRANGATVALMSGSGSATFGLVPDYDATLRLREKFLEQFGDKFWTSIRPLRDPSPPSAISL